VRDEMHLNDSEMISDPAACASLRTQSQHKELRASHEVVEAAMSKLVRRLGRTRSGVRYYLGEPKFGVVLTDKAAYVNTYAEPPAIQAVDLPIHRIEKAPGSLYGAFKRHFDDLWHNDSVPGAFQREHIDLETSAVGIVVCEHANRKFVALLKRDDGYWVLPKGNRMLDDASLEETAMREVCEETGLKREDLVIERALGYHTYDETAERLKVSKIVHLYHMRYAKNTKPILNCPEFADAKWWSIHEPLPEMLHTYQKSYLHEVVEAEGGRPNSIGAT